MAANHTPGPWTFLQRAGRDCQVEVPGRRIATVYGNYTTDTERDANAALITAAPDLLAAALCTIAALTQPKLYPADAACAVKALTDAVTKSRGEA